MRRLLVLVSICCAASCATTGGAETGEDGIVYGADADSNLKKGDEALESKNFPEAQHYFEFVKTKYPFLEAAKIAELKLADVDFERDRFIEARDRYQTFIRLHPTHPKVDYAAFRGALSHYKDIPSDFFLLPPSEEKDQVEVKNALVAMQDFVRLYPDSTYVPEAKKVIDDVKKRLADHELYVAGFYKKRERWPAVVNRLNVVAKSYSGVGVDDQVALGLAEAYRALHDDAKAADVLKSFLEKNPDSPGAGKAKKALAAIGTPSSTPPAPSSGAPDAGT
jgi:outer membrane protein assembly factor BamD